MKDVPPAILAFVLLGAAPYWQTRPPAQWTDDQMQEFFRSSPWAQPAVGPQQGGEVVVYLATAKPVREAETELARRATKGERPTEGLPGRDEYREFLRDNEGKIIVLAVPVPGGALDDPREVSAMEKGCVLKVGRRKYKIAGHFPPAGSDSYLRLVFPRAVTESDKKLVFELYLPGTAKPYREVEFRVKDLIFEGKPEM